MLGRDLWSCLRQAPEGDRFVLLKDSFEVEAPFMLLATARHVDAGDRPTTAKIRICLVLEQKYR